MNDWIPRASAAVAAVVRRRAPDAAAQRCVALALALARSDGPRSAFAEGARRIAVAAGGRRSVIERATVLLAAEENADADVDRAREALEIAWNFATGWRRGTRG